MPGRDHEHGVSPVVGVMLMLAVTVMIAAIVSSYAGGLSGGGEKSPQSSIRATPDLLQHRIYFEHSGGDAFSLASVNVVLRSGDNKITISAAGSGSGTVRYLAEAGSSSGTGSSTDAAVKPGDTFYVEGTGAGDPTVMKFGSLTLTNTSKVTWFIVDKESGRTISMGSFFL